MQFILIRNKKPISNVITRYQRVFKLYFKIVLNIIISVIKFQSFNNVFKFVKFTYKPRLVKKES